jgi:phenylacetate-CoA ligase
MDRTTGFLSPNEETASWDETVSVHEKKLGKVLSHAWDNAPAARATMEKAGASPGDIKTLDDLQKIPVTPKAELVRMQVENPPFGGLLAVDASELEYIFRSPGPIFDPKARGEGWGWEQALYAGGLRPGDITINTFGYHMTPAGKMFEAGATALGCSVIPTGIGERETQVELMKALGVNGFIGMASFLLQIGEKAVELGLDPRKDLNLRAAFSTAEPLPDTLRNSVEEMFGLICRQGYGTADCGCIAYECYQKGGMHVSSQSIVEIVDPTTGQRMPDGEIGEVVVTLFNRAYPLIRFGTGDLSAIDPGSCSCGRTSPKLRGWLGRADDLVKVKGMFIHPGMVRQAMGGFPQCSSYRLEVTRVNNRDIATMKIEKVPGVDESLSGALADACRKTFAIGCAVEWVDADSLPKDGLVLEDTRKWD